MKTLAAFHVCYHGNQRMETALLAPLLTILVQQLSWLQIDSKTIGYPEKNTSMKPTPTYTAWLKYISNRKCMIGQGECKDRQNIIITSKKWYMQPHFNIRYQYNPLWVALILISIGFQVLYYYCPFLVDN